jgi:hypothetical protein
MFIKRMNDAEEKALYDAAGEVASIFRSVEYQWWMSHQTLLNSFYFRGLAPWHDCVEFAFPRESITEIESMFVANGWEFKRMSPFNAKVWNPKMALHRPRFGWSWPFIDLMLYDDVSNRGIIMMEHGHCAHFTPFKRDELVDTHPYYFGPLMLPMVKRAETFMDVVFPKWRTELASAYYCHRIERLYPEPVQYEHPQELAKRFTMYNLQEQQQAS